MSCSATAGCQLKHCQYSQYIFPFEEKKMFQKKVFTTQHVAEKPGAENDQARACLVSCPATTGCQLKHYQHSDYDLCGWAPSPPPQV